MNVELPQWYPDLASFPIQLKRRSEPEPRNPELLADLQRHFDMWGFASEAELSGADRVHVPLLFLGNFEIYDAEYSVWELPGKGLVHAGDYLILRASWPDHHHFSAYSNYRTIDREKILTPEQFVYWDYHRYLERERVLDVYRSRIEQHPKRSGLYFQLGLITIQFWTESRPDVLNQGPRSWPGSLREAERPLREAVKLAPRNARYSALLGFLLHLLLEPGEAAGFYRRAAEREPSKPLYWMSLAAALSDCGEEKKAEEAYRQGRKLLRARGTSPSYHDFFSEWETYLDRAAERIRRKVEKIELVSERELAEQDRASIQISPKAVPDSLADLIPMAKKWGVGDDSSRGFFTNRAKAAEKRQLENALKGRWAKIEEWLDSFDEGEMTVEAAAFMYMMEAACEMGLTESCRGS